MSDYFQYSTKPKTEQKMVHDSTAEIKSGWVDNSNWKLRVITYCCYWGGRRCETKTILQNCFYCSKAVDDGIV